MIGRSIYEGLKVKWVPTKNLLSYRYVYNHKLEVRDSILIVDAKGTWPKIQLNSLSSLAKTKDMSPLETTTKVKLLANEPW